MMSGDDDPYNDRGTMKALLLLFVLILGGVSAIWAMSSKYEKAYHARCTRLGGSVTKLEWGKICLTSDGRVLF